MTVYFVSSAGNNTTTSGSSDWTTALTSLQAGLDLATTDGDIVVIQYNGVPTTDNTLSASKTYTVKANIAIISATNDGGTSYTPQVMDGTSSGQIIGNSAQSVTFAGGFRCYIYGIAVKVTNNAVYYKITIASGDNSHFELEDCKLLQPSTSSNVALTFGTGNTNYNGYVKLTNCTINLAHISSNITCRCPVEIFGGSLTIGTNGPRSGLFTFGTGESNGTTLTVDGFDFSALGDYALIAASNAVGGRAVFRNCKKPATYTVNPLTTQPSNLGGADLLMLNCSGGDTHYSFEYYNAFGSLIAVTSPYFDSGSATTNALFDGTNNICWQITTTPVCTYYTPFVTPWVETYHSGTSAITPYFEICRSGSSTSYKNDEVWGEFSAQATSGSVLPVFKNDRRALTTAPGTEPQTTGAGASYWTGENATSWYGKIDSGSSVTPAEIGMLRGRVYVGAASATVYVDPYIRT